MKRPKAVFILIHYPVSVWNPLIRLPISEQITYKGVWADAQTEAAVRFRVDFITEVTKCYQINTECDYDAMICANKELFGKCMALSIGQSINDLQAIHAPVKPVYHDR